MSLLRLLDPEERVNNGVIDTKIIGITSSHHTYNVLYLQELSLFHKIEGGRVHWIHMSSHPIHKITLHFYVSTLLKTLYLHGIYKRSVIFCCFLLIKICANYKYFIII